MIWDAYLSMGGGKYSSQKHRTVCTSRSELEALKRFPDYEELSDGTLMRIEGNKEFRIYCHDVEGSPLGVLNTGFL